MVIRIAIGVALVLATTWLLLLAVLLWWRPRGALLREAIRLLPDTLRLLKDLALDGTIPRVARVWLWLLLGYLAMPFDLIPDFVPVIGYADDAIVAVLVLRAVVRRAGLEAVRRHWRGSDDGLRAVLRLAGLSTDTASGSA